MLQYQAKGLGGDALRDGGGGGVGASVILSISSMAGQKGFALCH